MLESVLHIHAVRKRIKSRREFFLLFANEIMNLLTELRMNEFDGKRAGLLLKYFCMNEIRNANKRCLCVLNSLNGYNLN